jgi:hypothetical protein
LLGVLSGLPAPRNNGPVQLSADGTTLVINGGAPMVFKSRAQIAALRKLVAAYYGGQRIRAADLTSLRALNRLFGPERWKQLSTYIKSKDGGWGFEP